MKSVLEKLPTNSGFQSVVSRILCALIGERDWSASEVCHLNLRLHLAQSSRSTILVDCRPQEDQTVLLMQPQSAESLRQVKSVLKKYEDRQPGIHNINFLDFLLHYNHIKKPYQLRPRANPPILQYYPLYKPDNVENYYRVKAMLHHPFTKLADLKGSYPAWKAFHDNCISTQCHHKPDFMDKPVVEPVVDDEFEDLSGLEDILERPSWADMAGQLPPRYGEAAEDWGDLGSREIDISYDWRLHIVDTEMTAIDGDTFWKQQKEEDPAIQAFAHSQSASDSINPAQRQVYDYIDSHYEHELRYGVDQSSQLLLHIDGSAGSGKSFLIEVLSSHIAEVARRHGKPDPIARCAPTGVAAHNINGRTIHGLFNINPQSRTTEIKDAQRSYLQLTLKDIRYIIIDEKSMIGLHLFGQIDACCREANPHCRDIPFGGINIIVIGDFAQLPPVFAKPLYYNEVGTDNDEIFAEGDAANRRGRARGAKLSDVEEAASHLYRQFDKTVILTQIVRQQGEDEESRAFRGILQSLRTGILAVDQWRKLVERVQSNLSAAEVQSFYDALRIFPTKAGVDAFNVTRLRESIQPVLMIKSINQPNAAAKADLTTASNLLALLPVALDTRVMLTANIWVQRGLVNGSIGTIRGVQWAPSTQTPRTEMPHLILVEFDHYAADSPAIDINGRRCVPVFYQTREFSYQGLSATRTQFPLIPAYAITVHKSQGITVDQAVLNISAKEFSVGLSYVAVSRVKTFQGLMFEESFDHEKFKKSSNAGAFALRISDYERRLQQPLPVFQPPPGPNLLRQQAPMRQLRRGDSDDLPGGGIRDEEDEERLREDEEDAWLVLTSDYLSELGDSFS